NDEGRYAMKTSELNSNTSVRTTMKSERWNQGLSPAGKLPQPSDLGPLRSANNEKELWDSRTHQTEKEIGEGMPKVLGLRRLKQGKGCHQPSTNIGGNLPPNGMLLSHHAQPFIPSSLHTSTVLVPTHVNPYSQPSANLVHGQALNSLFQTYMGNPSAGDTFTYQGGYIPQAFTNNSIPSYNGPMHPTVTLTSSYPFYTQSMYAPPNMPAYPNLAGPFIGSAGSVTPFV
ncbi:hypothetical protein Tco_0777063, partial [Tanacetum coccineum]